MDEAILQILEQLEKKQEIMEGILSTTQDIDAMFQINDAQRADMALNIRTEQINEAMNCDEEIGRIIDQMELSQGLKIEKIIKLDLEGMEPKDSERALIDGVNRIKHVAGKALEIDKKFSLKIIGESSLYQK